jgi:hypothetical protein
MTGHLPYLYQCRALSLLRKMHRLSTSQKAFQFLVSQFLECETLCRWLSDTEDLFTFQWKMEEDISSRDKACLIVLKTFLKMEVLGAIREMLF